MSAADPLGATVQAGPSSAYGPPPNIPVIAAPQQPAFNMRSPMASSAVVPQIPAPPAEVPAIFPVVTHGTPNPYAPSAPASAQPAGGYGPPGVAPPFSSPYGTSAPPPVPGARVLVQWADGNRYPAVVAQVVAGQCLVVFIDRRQEWVPLPYLWPAP